MSDLPMPICLTEVKCNSPGDNAGTRASGKDGASGYRLLSSFCVAPANASCMLDLAIVPVMGFATTLDLWLISGLGLKSLDSQQ